MSKEQNAAIERVEGTLEGVASMLKDYVQSLVDEINGTDGAGLDGPQTEAVLARLTVMVDTFGGIKPSAAGPAGPVMGADPTRSAVKSTLRTWNPIPGSKVGGSPYPAVVLTRLANETDEKYQARVAQYGNPTRNDDESDAQYRQRLQDRGPDQRNQGQGTQGQDNQGWQGQNQGNQPNQPRRTNETEAQYHARLQGPMSQGLGVQSAQGQRQDQPYADPRRPNEDEAAYQSRVSAQRGQPGRSQTGQGQRDQPYDHRYEGGGVRNPGETDVAYRARTQGQGQGPGLGHGANPARGEGESEQQYQARVKAAQTVQHDATNPSYTGQTDEASTKAGSDSPGAHRRQPGT